MVVESPKYLKKRKGLFLIPIYYVWFIVLHFENILIFAYICMFFKIYYAPVHAYFF